MSSPDPMVDHPAHYNGHPSGVECIELIRYLNFNLGSAVKYVFRRGEKGSVVQDLEKAVWYLRDFHRDPSGEIRHPSDRPHPGQVGLHNRRWLWDRVIAAEPDSVARAFYLAVADIRLPEADQHLHEMLEGARRG